MMLRFWTAAPDAPLREVIVSVGDATLVLSDPRTDRPLSHWSLPAVVQLNPGVTPAIYAPTTTGEDETVTIDDPLMIEAIARVQGAVASHRAHTGRLRNGLLVLAILAALGWLVFWLPGALIGHAARIARNRQHLRRRRSRHSRPPRTRLTGDQRHDSDPLPTVGDAI